MSTTAPTITSSTERFGCLVRNRIPAAPKFGQCGDTDINVQIELGRTAA